MPRWDPLVVLNQSNLTPTLISSKYFSLYAVILPLYVIIIIIIIIAIIAIIIINSSTYTLLLHTYSNKNDFLDTIIIHTPLFPSILPLYHEKFVNNTFPFPLLFLIVYLSFFLLRTHNNFF